METSLLSWKEGPTVLPGHGKTTSDPGPGGKRDTPSGSPVGPLRDEGDVGVDESTFSRSRGSVYGPATGLVGERPGCRLGGGLGIQEEVESPWVGVENQRWRW